MANRKEGSAIHPPGGHRASTLTYPSAGQPAARGPVRGSRGSPAPRGKAPAARQVPAPHQVPAGRNLRRRSSAFGLLLWALAAGAAGLVSALTVSLVLTTTPLAASKVSLRGAQQKASAPGVSAPEAQQNRSVTPEAAKAGATAKAAPAQPATAAPTATPATAPAPGKAGSAPASAAADAPGWPDPVRLARTFVQMAGNGDPAVAATLLPGREVPYRRLTDLQAVPEDGGALLPGPGPEQQVLLPVAFRRPGLHTRGYLRVQVVPARDGYLVAGLEGPIAPREDWQSFDLPLLDANRKELPALKGPAILWAPQWPAPELVLAMEKLRQALEGQVQVLMAIDLSTPGGWDRTARAQGWQGPVVWVRGYLDRYPLPAHWPFLGARGVLVHPDGRVVASLGELDPARFGLPLEHLPEVATRVLQGYGLLPAPS